AAAWPLAARAQQAPRTARLGYLAPTSNPDLQQALLEGFATLATSKVRILQSNTGSCSVNLRATTSCGRACAPGSRRDRRMPHTTSARGKTANYHHSHYHDCQGSRPRFAATAARPRR